MRLDPPHANAPEMDAAHALLRVRKAEAIHWAGLMLAIAPVIAWSSLFAACLARMFAVMANNKNANPSLDPIVFVLLGIIMIASPMLPIGIALAIVGKFLRWRQERRWNLETLPAFPLMAGERLGSWVVEVAEPDRLVMCRRPIHRFLWNPTRIIIRLAQGVLVGSAIEAGFLGGGWQGAAVAAGLALAWALAWTTAMVERSFAITTTEHGTDVEFRTSFDPFWPSRVRTRPGAEVAMLILIAGQAFQKRTPKGHFIVSGLCAGKLGLWQRTRLAAELQHRSVRPLQLNTPPVRSFRPR